MNEHSPESQIEMNCNLKLHKVHVWTYVGHKMTTHLLMTFRNINGSKHFGTLHQLVDQFNMSTKNIVDKNDVDYFANFLPVRLLDPNV